eukprot:Polyplicarium_translucidae@DN2865_c0_g1_i3.p1
MRTTRTSRVSPPFASSPSSFIDTGATVATAIRTSPSSYKVTTGGATPHFTTTTIRGTAPAPVSSSSSWSSGVPLLTSRPRRIGPSTRPMLSPSFATPRLSAVSRGSPTVVETTRLPALSATCGMQRGCARSSPVATTTSTSTSVTTKHPTAIESFLLAAGQSPPVVQCPRVRAKKLSPLASGSPSASTPSCSAQSMKSTKSVNTRRIQVCSGGPAAGPHPPLASPRPHGAVATALPPPKKSLARGAGIAQSSWQSKKSWWCRGQGLFSWYGQVTFFARKSPSVAPSAANTIFIGTVAESHCVQPGLVSRAMSRKKKKKKKKKYSALI